MKLIKNIIWLVVIAAILYGVYVMFIQSDPEVTSLLRTTGQEKVDVLGEEIIRALNQIDSLVLDKSILNDPVVRELVDHSEPLNPEPIGRPDPFAPIGGFISSDSESGSGE